MLSNVIQSHLKAGLPLLLMLLMLLLLRSLT
jgi:hypothetical protein